MIIKGARSLQGEAFDLVFLDPPYRAGLIPPALRALQRFGLMGPGASSSAKTKKPNPIRWLDMQLKNTKSMEGYILPF